MLKERKYKGHIIRQCERAKGEHDGEWRIVRGRWTPQPYIPGVEWWELADEGYDHDPRLPAAILKKAASTSKHRSNARIENF